MTYLESDEDSSSDYDDDEHRMDIDEEDDNLLYTRNEKHSIKTDQYVECSRCGIWRHVPNSFFSQKRFEKMIWTCSLNEWNPRMVCHESMFNDYKISYTEIVYLVQPACNIGTNTYKIGRSDEISGVRVTSYGRKGTRVLRINAVSNSRLVEKQLINGFKKTFGVLPSSNLREYFECSNDETEITKLFDRIVQKENM